MLGFVTVAGLLSYGGIAQTVPMGARSGTRLPGQPVAISRDGGPALGINQDLHGDLGGERVTPRASGAVAQLLSSLFGQLYVVPDWFRLPGDGTDDAPAIRRAQALGLPLHFYCRHYNIQSPSTFATRLEWSGCGWTELGASSQPATWLDMDSSWTGTDLGTNAVATGVNGAAFPFTLTGVETRGSIVERMAFSQAQVLPPPGQAAWRPAFMEPIFLVTGVPGMTTFRDLFFPGVLYGIESIASGRLVVEHVWGQFYQWLVAQDQAYDISRFVDIEAWPYRTQQAAVLAYQQANSDTLYLQRSDTPYVDRLFSFGVRSSIHLGQSAFGGTTGGQFTDLQCDSAKWCIWIDNTNTAVANFQVGNMRSFAQASEPAPYLNGSITGRVLTVNYVTVDFMKAGMVLAGAGVAANTSITSLGTGTGGAGTYNLSTAPTAPTTSETMTGGMPVALVPGGGVIEGDGSFFAQIGGIWDYGSASCTICLLNTASGDNLTIGGLFVQNPQFSLRDFHVFEMNGPDQIQMATNPNIVALGRPSGFAMTNGGPGSLLLPTQTAVH